MLLFYAVLAFIYVSFPVQVFEMQYCLISNAILSFYVISKKFLKSIIHKNE